MGIFYLMCSLKLPIVHHCLNHIHCVPQQVTKCLHSIKFLHVGYTFHLNYLKKTNVTFLQNTANLQLTWFELYEFVEYTDTQA
jgi:hypothetical protein